MTVSNVVCLFGGTGADTIYTLSLHDALPFFDLGSGADKLTLANVANAGTISNVESIVGGSANDTITVDTQASSASLDLAAGSEKLNLAYTVNTATVTNVETLLGGSANNTITL